MRVSFFVPNGDNWRGVQALFGHASLLCSCHQLSPALQTMQRTRCCTEPWMLTNPLNHILLSNCPMTGYTAGGALCFSHTSVLGVLRFCVCSARGEGLCTSCPGKWRDTYTVHFVCSSGGTATCFQLQYSHPKS